MIARINEIASTLAFLVGCLCFAFRDRGSQSGVLEALFFVGMACYFGIRHLGDRRTPCEP